MARLAPPMATRGTEEAHLLGGGWGAAVAAGVPLHKSLVGLESGKTIHQVNLEPAAENGRSGGTVGIPLGQLVEVRDAANGGNARQDDCALTGGARLLDHGAGLGQKWHSCSPIIHSYHARPSAIPHQERGARRAGN